MLADAGIPGARWVPPENYHLTLRFIGETPRTGPRRSTMRWPPSRRRAFLDAGWCRHLRQGRPTQSLGLGVERNPQLDHLQSKIETALQRCGLEPERRRFQPHVTLARLDNAAEGKLAAFVQAHNLFRAEPVPVEHFTLFSSLLGKDQPVYTPEVEYPLD